MTNGHSWLILPAVVIGGGLAATFITGQTKPLATWETDLWPRLQIMMVVAALIERSVEVYLNASGGNGPDRFDPAATGQSVSAGRAAGFASILLGLLVALVGLRLLSVVSTPPNGEWARGLWAGVDITISGGLMAGGATLFHELAETIRGGLNRLSHVVGPTDAARASTFAASAPYRVRVHRTAADSGTLSFSGGGVQIETPCWWDAKNRIPGGTYAECSKTRMATKTDSVTGEARPGIFLPGAVAPDTGKATIFIHEGKDPSWSDGCLVIERAQMIRLWNAIQPADARNVTVEVIDS